MSYAHEVAWRAAQITNGKCVKCTNPAVPGLRMCTHHREWERQYSMYKDRVRRGEIKGKFKFKAA